mgnify:FL=1
MQHQEKLSIWQKMERDDNSPLWRLYRLQAQLLTGATALKMNDHETLTTLHLQHIQSVIQQAYDASELIACEMEKWLDAA